MIGILGPWCASSHTGSGVGPKIRQSLFLGFAQVVVKKAIPVFVALGRTLVQIVNPMALHPDPSLSGAPVVVHHMLANRYPVFLFLFPKTLHPMVHRIGLPTQPTTL